MQQGLNRKEEQRKEGTYRIALFEVDCRKQRWGIVGDEIDGLYLNEQPGIEDVLLSS